jgi:hypothetical protein
MRGIDQLGVDGDGELHGGMTTRQSCSESQPDPRKTLPRHSVVA